MLKLHFNEINLPELCDVFKYDNLPIIFLWIWFAFSFLKCVLTSSVWCNGWFDKVLNSSDKKCEQRGKGTILLVETHSSVFGLHRKLAKYGVCIFGLLCQHFDCQRDANVCWTQVFVCFWHCTFVGDRQTQYKKAKNEIKNWTHQNLARRDLSSLLGR